MSFPTTHWTILAQATLSGDAHAGKALGSFILRYREPVMRFIRSRGVSESRVEDLTHDFFLRLMKNSTLKQAHPARGRFRSFLGTALKCFLADDMDRNHAQKRGGGSAHVSLDANDGIAENLALRGGVTTDAEFDRSWALHILEKTLAAIQAEWEHGGKAARFTVLRHFLPGGTAAISQAEAAVVLGLTDTALRSEIFRLRTRFRELLRTEVAATVPGPADIESEMHHLHAALSHPGLAYSEENLQHAGGNA